VGNFFESGLAPNSRDWKHLKLGTHWSFEKKQKKFHPGIATMVPVIRVSTDGNPAVFGEKAGKRRKSVRRRNAGDRMRFRHGYGPIDFTFEKSTGHWGHYLLPKVARVRTSELI